MPYKATLALVKNRGVPPTAFLDELVQWAKTAHIGLFAINASRDVYSLVRETLGPEDLADPWTDINNRRAAMLEVLRVLGGFESSWNWNEGIDKSAKDRSAPETQEAGLWQVSMNAVAFGEDLKQLVKAKIGTANYSQGKKFQASMKSDHGFAMEFITRLLRHTINHNGPLKTGAVLPWLKRDAVAEFQRLLA